MLPSVFYKFSFASSYHFNLFYFHEYTFLNHESKFRAPVLEKGL